MGRLGLSSRSVLARLGRSLALLAAYAFLLQTALLSAGFSPPSAGGDLDAARAHQFCLNADDGSAAPAGAPAGDAHDAHAFCCLAATVHALPPPAWSGLVRPLAVELLDYGAAYAQPHRAFAGNPAARPRGPPLRA